MKGPHADRHTHKPGTDEGTTEERSVRQEDGRVGEGFVLPAEVTGTPLLCLLPWAPGLRPLRSLLPLPLRTAAAPSGSASPLRLRQRRLPRRALPLRKAWRLPKTTWYLPGKPCSAKPRLSSAAWPRDWMEQMTAREGRRRAGRACRLRSPFLPLVPGPSAPWVPRVNHGPAHFLLCLLVPWRPPAPNLSLSPSPRRPRSSPPPLSSPPPADPRAGPASRGGGCPPCSLP